MKILSQSFSAMLGVMLASLMILSAGCGKSPEEARKELAAMNVSFTPDSFVEHAKNSDMVVVKLFLVAGMNVNAERKS